jgi:two-component sensor histidine kinase
MQEHAPSGMETIPALKWGSHVCHAFEREHELGDILVPYFKAGLANNEACFWVTAAPFNAEMARTALRSAVPDFDAREAANQIEILDDSTRYKPGDALKPDDFLADLTRREREALDRGYEGLRTNGNCAWIAAEQWSSFQSYEEGVQELVRGRRMICLCSYGPQQTRSPGFYRIICCHDMLLSPKPGAAAPAHAAQSASAPGQDAKLADVLITEQLSIRQPTAPHHQREKRALEALAHRMADEPSDVLPQLVKIALDVCDADSAGVSVLEGEKFRWLGLHGTLSAFEDATTPRNDSPCGVCLDRNSVILMRHPERIYSWIADANIVVPEVMLVPLRTHGHEQIGTLWVVARNEGHFNAEHSRVLADLATFTGVALHMIGSKQRLSEALEQERLIASEMSHRIKNIYTVASSIVNLSAARAANTKELAESVTARLAALSEAHALARNATGVELRDLLHSLLRPYSNYELSGPQVYLGEQPLGSLAMAFHELATNAVKYGALSVQGGRVGISWTCDQTTLELLWREQNGPAPEESIRDGFGSSVIRSSIRSLNGTISRAWPQSGLEASIVMPLASIADPIAAGHHATH